MPRTRILIAALAVAAGACGSGGESVFSLSVGDCFDDPEEIAAEIDVVDVVDCGQPHDNEIYLVTDYTGGGSVFPGDATMQEAAFDMCLATFEAFVGRDYASSALDFIFLAPSAQSWSDGDREVICAVYNMDLSKQEGSARGSGR